MASSLFLPLEEIRPGEFISQYSDWIYFTLTLVFFLAVAGVTLRKHFDKPYIKPLIISVALLMTFGVFTNRWMLTRVFEGWGIVGMVILAFMAATIPYGLCRGSGLPGAKAFYLTYILFYILAWVKVPQVFYSIGDSNMGLLNVALLILFLVSIYKVVRFGRGSGADTVSRLKNDLSRGQRQGPQIRHELNTEQEEEGLIKTRGLKLNEVEIRSAEDMSNQLDEILQIIEEHENSLGAEERAQISRILSKIAGDEKTFLRTLEKVKEIFKRTEVMDKAELRKKLQRLKNVKGKEKKLLAAEIKLAEEKIELGKEIESHETELKKFIESLNHYLSLAVEAIEKSAYPLDAIPHLKKAGKVANEIVAITKKLEFTEKRLLILAKGEESLLKREA